MSSAGPRYTPVKGGGNELRTLRGHMQRTAGVLVVLGALGFGYWWGQSLKPVDMIRAQLHAIDEGE